MKWAEQWAIDVPGHTAHTIGFDARTDSVLVADGWGVAFASLSVRAIDVTTGAIRARVRTARSIRAFGVGPDDTLLLLGDKSVAVHDAKTFERRSLHDSRVPRYSNAIASLPDGRVALMAPAALIAYELATGRSRKLSKVPAVALGTVADKTLALRADGSVVAADGEPIGSFGAPCYTGCIDGSTGIIAALRGVRKQEPDRYEWPRSTTLLMACLGSDWAPKTIELPATAATVGVIGGHVVTVNTHQGPMRVVAIASDGKPEAAETFPTSLLGFAASRGIVAHSLDRRTEGTTIRLLVPAPE